MIAAAEKIPEPTRTVLLMALLGIALLGLFLVVMILLGGHWVRRIGSHRRGPSVPPDRAPVRRRESSVDDADRADGNKPSESGDTVDDVGETRID
ncbi:MAG: hypothetical protein CMJ58_15705 [Planctomycetaceae bacterium]|nr:hypothetical protein [Planctomycetaceae bacterium]